MRVSVTFTDGEVMEAESDSATLTKMGFPVSFTSGNNRVAWVSLAAIKHIVFRDGFFEGGDQDEDPRANLGLPKLVLHFQDGETLRTYKDDTFSQSDEGFMLRMWDPERRGLHRVLVSLHALKAVFYVNVWDSRDEEEKARFTAAKPRRVA